ncbi:MAG TPA: ROK family protein, partial [Solirubrobacteraceae bacterium]|nr:ROK family protein [Solirubrobacteraceae bacterium]
GIDIGSTTMRGWVEVLDDVADIFDSRLYLEPIRRPATARSVLEQVRDMVDRLLAEQFDGQEPPVGVGIAAPGPVDVRTGTLKFSPGLGLRNVPFKTVLANTYPELRFRVDNDTRCATRAELHLGIGREFEDFACIFVGSGVGSGVAIGRRLHFGHSYCAGEIGHVKIESSGPPCTCGQIGCLETFVNGPAIAARGRAKAIDWESRGAETLLTAEDRLTPEMIVAAIEDGDVAALEVADEIADRLGVGIANYLNLLNPAAIVLGGGVMTGFYLHIIGRLTQTVQDNALADVAQTPIVQSQFTDTGAALGASLMFHPDAAWPFD